MTDWQLCVVQSGLLSTRSSPRCAQLLPTRHARRQRTPSRSGSITLVVRTGRRAVALAELLRQGGLEPDGSRPRPPRLEHYEGPLRESILDLYRQLGGRLDQPNLRPGSWDLSMGGIVIELDEELHFNRYRSVTLQQAWASALPWTNDYVRHSATREHECLRAARWGKRWTNTSAERLFGPAAEPGDLDSAAGAPRWKQRALYDAMKDAHSVERDDVRVARLSVYDEIAPGVSVGAVLDGHHPAPTGECFRWWRLGSRSWHSSRARHFAATGRRRAVRVRAHGWWSSRARRRVGCSG
jgi:hypothetical protein